MTEDKDYEIAEPHAGAMIESLRAFGYDLRTAIADLIDNSIFAGAKNVWIYFHWNGADSYISITDDGYGMSETELYEAMRPGSKSPLEDREPSDLGRFGLGMKTASFSQCRRLTVASRKNKQNPAIRRWDLDHVTKVDRWELLKYAAPGSEQRIEYPDGLKNGTIVLWENLDRVVGDSPDCILWFNAAVKIFAQELRIRIPIPIEAEKAGLEAAVEDLDKFCKRGHFPAEIPMLVVAEEGYSSLKKTSNMLTDFRIKQIPVRLLSRK